MLNTLNLCSAVCPLYLNKTGGKTQNKELRRSQEDSTQMEKFYKKQINN